jgi:hypothetical protein
MASTAEAGMSAGSNLVSGAGAAVATFTLPASPLYRVESVVAHVDNTTGGDTTATLTYADTNGEVIAKHAQADTLDAGATGTATFALGLPKKRPTLRRFTHKRAIYTSLAQSIIVTGVAGSHALHWAYDSGDHILDLTTIDDRNPLTLFPGTLTVTLTMTRSPGIAGGLGNTVMDFNTPLGAFVSRGFPLDDVSGQGGFGGANLTQYCEKGTSLDAAAYHNQPVPTTFDFYFYVELDNVA